MMKFYRLTACVAALLVTAVAAWAQDPVYGVRSNGVKYTKSDFDQAVEAYNSKNYDQALATFQKVVAQQPGNGPAWAYIASIQQDRGLTDAALQSAQNSLNHMAAPADGRDSAFVAWLRNEMCTMHLAKADTAAAVADMQQAQALEPANEEYAMTCGSLLYRTGDLAGSEQAYRAAFALDTTSTNAMLALGSVLSEQGKPAEALQWMDRAVAAEPGDADVYAYRAGERFNQQQYSAAIDDVIRSLTLKHNHKHALWVMDHVALLDLSELVTRLVAQRSADPDNADYWNEVLQRVAQTNN